MINKILNYISILFIKTYYGLSKENNIYGYGEKVYDKYRKEYVFPYYIIHDDNTGYCKPTGKPDKNWNMIYKSYIADSYVVYIHREGIDMDFQTGTFETFIAAVGKLKSVVNEKES